MDFLARLGGRAAGEAPVLRPRPVSWYAATAAWIDAVPAGEQAGIDPSPSTVTAPQPHPADEARAATVRSGPGIEEDARPTTRTVRAHIRRPDRSTRLTGDAQRAGTVHQAAVDAAPGGSVPEPEPMLVERPSVDQASAEHPAPRAPSSHEAFPAARRVSRRTDRVEDVVPASSEAATFVARGAKDAPEIAPLPEARPAEPAGRTVRQLPAGPGGSNRASDRDRRHRYSEPAPLLSARGPAPATVLPPSVAVERGRSAAHEGPADEPAGQPVIEVTIGRVDVRAIPPPVAAPPDSPKPKRLSLDEYLRNRAGAGT